ncbi:MAG TPA: hypothetical protein VFD92_27995 [Candidatus Binatia bacterium]|nr:hypothetical protein [Candidatus Binatia bacterium]
MFDERSLADKIRAVLRPYASNWSGSLGRGDLVIPHADLSRVVEAIIDASRDAFEGHSPASDFELFQELSEARRLSSVQDQVDRLRARFHILTRSS